MGGIPSIALSQRSTRSRKSKYRGKGKTKMPKHPNPNPTPGVYPHPSSFRSLCEYIDDDIRNKICNYDDDMDHFRADHEHSGEWCPIHQVGGLVAIAAPQHLSVKSSSPEPSASVPPSQDPSYWPSSSSQPLPRPPSPTHDEPFDEPLEITACTAIRSYLSPYPSSSSSSSNPLSPTQRAEIEAFIPATILRLPMMFRACALSSWAKYMHKQQLNSMQVMMRQMKKRKGSTQKVTVLPWDEGIEEWGGSFPAEAKELVSVTRGESLYTRVPQPQGLAKRKSSEEVTHETYFQAKQGGGEECLDLNDGHAIGRDWACDHSGPAMLLYEQRDGGEEEEQMRKDSLFDRAVHVLKRAVPS
ncbi:hypothetical protein DPSP01_005582 [Paraphaeosphaeria sporulosa]